jgi:hypothetical protein
MGGLVGAGGIASNQPLFLRNNFGTMGAGNVRAAMKNTNQKLFF